MPRTEGKMEKKLMLTDLIPQNELAILLSRAARISGSALWIQDREGKVLASSEAASPPHTDKMAIHLYHEQIPLGVVTGLNGRSLGDVLGWVAEEIHERFQARYEIESLAKHITENYQELNCLFDVIQPLSMLFNLNVLENCQTVLVATSTLVHAPQAWLLIAFEDKPEFVSLHKTPDGEVVLDSYVLDKEPKGPWEYSFWTGKTINAARPSDLPDSVQLPQDLGVELPLLCLRMEGDRQPLGVLCFSGKTNSDFFDSTETKLITTITAHIGTLISNAQLQDTMHSLFLEAITALSTVMETKDQYTHGHVERVTSYATEIAIRMDFAPDHIERVRIAALLHDLGKIGIPDNILLKRGGLNEEETAIMRSHTMAGVKILKHFKHLAPIIPWIQGHHERPDGKGYPLGLKCHEIPVEAQILSVADAFDAMTSNRPYRQALPFYTAVKRLQEGSGTQFDEKVVEAFFQCDAFLNIKNLSTKLP